MEKQANAIVRAFARLFGKPENTATEVASEEEHQPISENMKTNADFKTINALLKKDALTAAEDGTLQISAEDMSAIEKRITDLEESEKTLKAQVTAFEKGDGASTEGVVVDEGAGDNDSVILADLKMLENII